MGSGGSLDSQEPEEISYGGQGAGLRNGEKERCFQHRDAKTGMWA